MSETIFEQMQKSPFRNFYWFARYLLNTDQFGAIGKQKEKQLLNIVSILETLASQSNFSEQDRLKLLKNTLSSELRTLANPNTKAYKLILNLDEQLERDNQKFDSA